MTSVRLSSFRSPTLAIIYFIRGDAAIFRSWDALKQAGVNGTARILRRCLGADPDSIELIVLAVLVSFVSGEIWFGVGLVVGDYSLRAHLPRAEGAGAHVDRVRGAEGTFDDLYRTYWKDLCQQLRNAFGSGPPEPEDVAQAAFERLAALEDPARVNNPRAFLLVTARNIVFDHKRRSGRHFEYARSVLSENSGPSLDELSPERLLIEKQRFHNIRVAVESLPYKQKVVLRLHRQLGYTYKRIAEETGWSYGDVYRQMEYALAALSGALKR